MKFNGVISRKIEIIEETLFKLRELNDVTIAKLNDDFFLKKGVERSLQICVEAVIDIAHRFVSLNNRHPCSTSYRALESLESIGVITSASVYKPMVQFRNIVVHRYEIVDNEIISGILKKHLDDFDRFIDEVCTYADG